MGILVTACSSGIGEATAQFLARAGWEVHATCRSDIGARRLKAQGMRVNQVDMRDEHGIDTLRSTTLVMFRRFVDAERSPHRVAYGTMVERLSTSGAVVPFTLPPEALADVVHRALLARHMKACYQVAFPSRLNWWLRGLLPVHWHDRLLARP